MLREFKVILWNKERTTFYKYPVRSVKCSCLWLLTDISDLLVSSRLGQFGSCEIVKKGIQKALAAKTTSLG